jgi:hypothetical protein
VFPLFRFLGRFACSNRRPPYCVIKREQVCSVTPSGLAASGNAVPHDGFNSAQAG